MCHTHMLIQDPERLLEDDDLEAPQAETGTDEETTIWTGTPRSEERSGQPLRARA